LYSSPQTKTSRPLSLLIHSLSVSLSNSITTQPAKLIDPKEEQIFTPSNATKVTIHNNAHENNCGVISQIIWKNHGPNFGRL
jgi:hypothetical protein